MMIEKLLIEEQIIKRWHQKTITRPSPIDLHPNNNNNNILKTFDENNVSYSSLRKELKKI